MAKVEFDQSRENDPAHLLEYYQSRVDFYIGKPGCQKALKAFKSGVSEMKRKLKTP